MQIEGDNPCFVYRLFDLNGRLLYVGMTSNVNLRLGQHAALQSWWPQVQRVVSQAFPTREEAAAEELRSIRVENPAHNIMHSTINSWPKRELGSGAAWIQGQGEHEIQVSRQGRWWEIAVTSIDAVTQARRVSDVTSMAKSLIAVSLDVPEDAVTLGAVRVDIDGNDVTDVLIEVQEITLAAAVARELADSAMRAAAAGLVKAGIPLRDVGSLLGVSFQRVGQLVKS